MIAKVDTSGTRAGLAALHAAIVHAAGEALHASLLEAQKHAQATTLFKDRAANDNDGLRRHIDVVFSGSVRGTLVANKPYALWVNDGTRPHIIRPKPDRKALRWIGAGGLVFRRIVHHPGTHPRPFMDQAAKFGEHVLADMLDRFTSHAIDSHNQRS